MGIRRDDISGNQRTPIVIEAMSPHRPHGTISRLAREHGVSRQTIYQMAAVGRAGLTEALTLGDTGRTRRRPRSALIVIGWCAGASF
jgi:transposase-like protein